MSLPDPLPAHPPGFSPRTAWPPAAYRVLVETARVSAPLGLIGGPGAAFESAAREIHRLCSRKPESFLRIDLSIVPQRDRLRASALPIPPGGTLFLLHGELLEVSPPRSASGLVVARESILLPEGSRDAARGPNVLKPPWLLLRIPHVSEYLRLAGCIEAAWKDWVGKRLSKIISASLAAQPWPGGEAEVLAVLLKAALQGTAPLLDYLSLAGNPSLSGQTTWRDRKKLLERALVEQALRETGGNQSQAARILGVHRNTLLWHLRRLRGRLDAQLPPK